MKTAVNITGMLAIVVLLLIPHLDITIPIDGGSDSPIGEAFAKSLADYMIEIAESNKPIRDKRAATVRAFENSAKVAYRDGMQSQVDQLQDSESTDELDALLLKIAGELQ